jgi:HK97 family phage prohead protease
VLQYSKPLPIQEIKAAGDGTWSVSGYVSTFGNVDRTGDVILAGAFDRALADGRRVKFLYAHDQAQVLGVPIELKADDHGLFGTFKISRTRLGEDVHTLLKDGALDSFSIGFFIDDLDFDPESGTRILKDIDLLEASVVAVPANPEALVTTVKQAANARLLRMDEHAELTVSTLKSFVDRCSDLASLRAGDGRFPGAAFFERLNAVRAATDELLSIKAAPAVVEPPPKPEPTGEPDEAAPPPADDAARGYSTLLALKRARLARAGILEMPSDEHDRRRCT